MLYAGPTQHLAELGWRTAERADTWRVLIGNYLQRGTHGEKKPERPDARVKDTRPGKVRCAPSALAGVGKQQGAAGARAWLVQSATRGSWMDMWLGWLGAARTLGWRTGLNWAQLLGYAW